MGGKWKKEKHGSSERRKRRKRRRMIETGEREAYQKKWEGNGRRREGDGLGSMRLVGERLKTHSKSGDS